MKQKLLLTFALLLTAVTGAWADDSGTCGSGVTWSYVESTKTLTISKTGEGTGAMADYPGGQPWNSYLDQITTLVIGEGVTSIGGYAFWSCEGLESITLPASLKTIGKMAFYLCSKLESISIPDGVTSIGDEAFGNCSNLASINIPAKVTSIGADTFYDCSKLAAINVADGNNNYSSDASGVLFDKNKTTLIQYPAGKTAAAYEIPASVTSIGDMAFFNCDKLTSVTFAGTSVKTIGDCAFYRCTNLASITIPASVTSIGEVAFYNCQNLATVAFAANSALTSIGNGAFYYCTILASINIPAGVTSIGADLFSGCSKLASVTIPAGVTSIGESAFYQCTNLASITIPASVTSIGMYAFFQCGNLGAITMNSSPLIGANSFKKIKDGATVAINAPAHDANDYQWATFYNENYAFQADENTQVFKVALDGTTVELLEVTDKIVNKNTAVVLKSTGTPVMTLTTASSSDTQGNDLVGTYETITNPGNAYVLNNGDDGVGFYKLANTGTIEFGKAYLVATAGARDFLGFDETTDISEKIKVKSEKSGEGGDVIYDIHGRRVNGKPGKGLYIINGKKVVL